MGFLCCFTPGRGAARYEVDAVPMPAPVAAQPPRRDAAPRAAGASMVRILTARPSHKQVSLYAHVQFFIDLQTQAARMGPKPLPAYQAQQKAQQQAPEQQQPQNDLAPVTPDDSMTGKMDARPAEAQADTPKKARMMVTAEEAPAAAGAMEQEASQQDVVKASDTTTAAAEVAVEAPAAAAYGVAPAPQPSMSTPPVPKKTAPRRGAPAAAASARTPPVKTPPMRFGNASAAVARTPPASAKAAPVSRPLSAVSPASPATTGGVLRATAASKARQEATARVSSASPGSWKY